MDIEILKQDKNLVEVRVNSLTIAEVLRAYLHNGGVKFVAWRREHPSKPILFKIESSEKTVKKAVSEAVEAVKKDCDKIAGLLKK